MNLRMRILKEAGDILSECTFVTKSNKELTIRSKRPAILSAQAQYHCVIRIVLMSQAKCSLNSHDAVLPIPRNVLSPSILPIYNIQVLRDM